MKKSGVCPCSGESVETGECKQALLCHEEDRSDDSVFVLDLTRISIYLTCIQTFVASLLVYLAMGLSACFLVGSAARTILVGFLTGIIFTSKHWTSDRACALILNNVLVPLAVVVPIGFLSIIQLEASAVHEQSDETEKFDTPRNAIAIAAMVLAGLAALERTLWPKSRTEVDFLLSFCACALTFFMHPELETLDPSSEPLCECPNLETAVLRVTRLATWVTLAQTVVLCAVPDVVSHDSTPRILLCAASASLWTLLCPIYLLPIASVQMVLIVARRNGQVGYLDAAVFVIKPPEKCMVFVRIATSIASSFARCLGRLRECECAARIPWRTSPPQPFVPYNEPIVKPLPTKIRPVIDCTSARKEDVVESLSRRIYGADDISVGVAKLVANGHSVHNPHTVRTMQRLSAVLSK